jgi:hypothetical protein
MVIQQQSTLCPLVLRTLIGLVTAHPFHMDKRASRVPSHEDLADCVSKLVYASQDVVTFALHLDEGFQACRFSRAYTVYHILEQ